MLSNDLATATPPDTTTLPDDSQNAPRSTGNGGLRRFYAYQFVTETQFTGGIWILYLKSQGFSLGQIGLAESAFHLAPVLLEIPSGSFADLFGRRWSLAIGSLLIALSSALLFFADSLPLMLLAMFLNGASYSFRSGANQAFLYDSLGAERQGGYAGILGKLMGASYIIAGATTWIGAALSDVSWSWPYGLAVAMGLGGAWLATGLAEPQMERDEEHVSRSPLRHTREVFTALRARPHVGAMLFFSAGFWTASTIVFLYLQAAFSDRGLSNSTIGLVLGSAFAFNALGSAFAGRAERWGKFSTQLVLMGLVVGALTAGTALDPVWLAVVAYILSQVATGLMEPLLFAWFNRQLPSAQRATLLSLDSWLFSVIMIVAFPFAGWFADNQGWGLMIVIAGSIKIALTLLVVAGMRLRGRGTAATSAS
jgi:MFS family permease